MIIPVSRKKEMLLQELNLELDKFKDQLDRNFSVDNQVLVNQLTSQIKLQHRLIDWLKIWN